MPRDNRNGVGGSVRWIETKLWRSQGGLKAAQKGWLTEAKRRINKQAVLEKSLCQAVMIYESNKNNNSKYLKSTFYISNTALRVLWMLTHLILIIILWNMIASPIFSGERHWGTETITCGFGQTLANGHFFFLQVKNGLLSESSYGSYLPNQ